MSLASRVNDLATRIASEIKTLAPKANAVQAACTATANPNSTGNVLIAGLSLTITSPGTSAQYEVVIDADAQITVGGTANIVELLVDNVPPPGYIVTSGPAVTRATSSRRWLITGLAAGSHTFTAQTRNTAASSGASVYSGSTAMTVKRVG